MGLDWQGTPEGTLNPGNTTEDANHFYAVTHVRERDSHHSVRSLNDLLRTWIMFSLSLTHDSCRWGRDSHSRTVLKVALCHSLTQGRGVAFSNRTAKISTVLLISVYHHVKWFYCAQRTLSPYNNFNAYIPLKAALHLLGMIVYYST